MVFVPIPSGGDLSLPNSVESHQDWRMSKLHKAPFTYKSFADPVGTSSETKYWDWVETRESYGHPYQFLGRTHRNIGGKFVHTILRMDKMPVSPVLYRAGSTWRESSGPLFPSGSFYSRVTGVPTSYEEAMAQTTSDVPLFGDHVLDSRGATAIARCAPTNPMVDLSTSVAELLREGLPQLPGSNGNLGGEYLNVMFGYLPLHGDLSDLGITVRKVDKLLRQLERDSGRWIRRRYEFPPEKTSVSETTQNAAVHGAGSGLSQLGVLSTTTTIETKVWFEGAFTYYLPRKGWRRTVAELDYLYGVKPGIDTAWNLIGYSWLVDYFANVGDVIHNLNAFTADGLVLPYGYVMCERTMTREESWTGNLYSGGSPTKTTVSNSMTSVTKQRRLANPFGFGLLDEDLNVRQQSILVALGISRL